MEIIIDQYPYYQLCKKISKELIIISQYVVYKIVIYYRDINLVIVLNIPLSLERSKFWGVANGWQELLFAVKG